MPAVESKPKCAATLRINSAAKMTPKGRASIAKWLRAAAKELVSNGSRFSPQFTARYFYTDEAKSKFKS